MARFSNGWVKLYHEAIDGDIGDDPFVLGTFAKLLIWANWKEGSAKFDGKRVTLSPGQLITGLRELSPDVELDPYLHRIRRALTYLMERGTITQQTSNRGRLITICNWDKYQGRDSITRNETASQEQAARKQTANRPQLSKEYKKEENTNTGSEEVKTAIEEWRKTLLARGISKNPYSDRDTIQTLVDKKGLEATLDAIRGLRFEAGGKDYDPSKFCYLSRLTKNRFEKFGYFEAIGARHKDADQERDFFEPQGDLLAKEDGVRA